MSLISSLIVALFILPVILLGLLPEKPNSVLGQQQVTLTAIVAEPKERWDILFENALSKLRENHPELDIQVDYRVLPYDVTRTQILTAIAGQTPIDIISVDQIWLGEFAEGGFLTDISDRVDKWARSDEWYPTNWEGGKYNNKTFGIWAWTDVRALWYWKDLLQEAEVNPEDLKTWPGYIESARKLNDVLNSRGIQATHLVGANHAPDMWYPYLWMLGGNILELKDNHPQKGRHWFPAYNSSEGVTALEFIKEQVDSGIAPQPSHFWGQEFVDKKFAVMLEGSWILGSFPREEWPTLSEQVGMLPLFPTPQGQNDSSTMMGGWILSIPQASTNKDLAWELLTLMVDPTTLVPMLQQEGYLPTQKPIAEGEYASELNSTIPYYTELVSMLPIGHSRPNIPEYPQIAENIKQAMDEVFYNVKEPKQALDDAAKRSAEILGW